MFPPDSPQGTRACQLCCEALEQQRAALASDAYRPPPARRLQPTADTPLAVRGVAMDRAFDDELLSLVHSMRRAMVRAGRTCSAIQVVDLGCGFGTRPWSLPLSSNVHWFDVDLPAVLQEKQALLEAAGAAMEPPPPHCDLPGSADGSSSGGGSSVAPVVPLRVGRYRPVVSHILKSNFWETLEAQGWDPASPTIWIAFALIYHLDSRAADYLMKSIATASKRCACSAFLGTVMNRAMVALIEETVGPTAVALSTGSISGMASFEVEGEAPASAAAFDPEISSLDISDAAQPGGGAQAFASAIKFGCKRSTASFLAAYGWDSVEEITAWDVEQMYNILTVGLDDSVEVRERVAAHHGGQEPLCSLGVGRKNF